jgi:hypothetical protein
MDKISFYDLDYIISSNEKRLEEFTNAYQKNLDKFTNVLIIYSVIAVFLVPIIQTLFFTELRHWLHYTSFFLFSVVFLYSLFYLIKLLIPVDVAYLIEPKTFYEKLRLEYEAEGKNKEVTDNYLKASYINELEKAVTQNNFAFKRKGLFYFRALTSALISLIPYLICLAFHFSIKSDNIQKVEIVNAQKLINFNKNNSMPQDTKNNNSTSSSTTTTTTTQLPGINPNEVKPVDPQMIKENFHERRTKVDSGSKEKK